MRIASIAKHSVTTTEQSPIHLLLAIMTFKRLFLITYPTDADFIQCLLEAYTLIFISGDAFQRNSDRHLFLKHVQAHTQPPDQNSRYNIIIAHINKRDNS